MEAIVVKKKVLVVLFLIGIILGTLLFVFSTKKTVSKVPSISPTPTTNIVYIVLTPTPLPTASPSATPTSSLKRVVPTRSVTLPVLSPTQ